MEDLGCIQLLCFQADSLVELNPGFFQGFGVVLEAVPGLFFQSVHEREQRRVGGKSEGSDAIAWGPLSRAIVAAFGMDQFFNGFELFDCTGDDDPFVRRLAARVPAFVASSPR